MNKGVKIIYRKKIKQEHMLKGFEKLSGSRLPNPSSFKNTRIWQFNLSKDSALAAFEELLTLFELPIKSIDADRLLCKMIVKESSDVIFEAHKWDETYQLMSELGYI